MTPLQARSAASADEKVISYYRRLAEGDLKTCDSSQSFRLCW
jgi:hypothetical protein